jgi:hypothetical protein
MKNLLKPLLFAATLAIACGGVAQENTDPDVAYRAKFLEKHASVSPAPSKEEYASAGRYDGLYLGESLDKALANVTNENGGLAWGLSYRMWSLNEMYRATGERKYLEANLRCIRATMAARDDKTGAELWTGAVAPAWSSGKYAQRGRAVFAVHTGIIVYPILDWALLAAGEGEWADEREAIVREALESIAFHDRQWREGPEDGAGHYVGVDQEDILEGKPLPGNRLSAMGLAHWAAYKLTEDEAQRARAVALGNYIRNRLTGAPDGAYYWGYWLEEEPVTAPASREDVKGEDTSHAGLTLAFPLLLGMEGVVFDAEDMRRFGHTVTKGFARLGDGVIMGDITGSPASNPGYVGQPAFWLPLARWHGPVREAIWPSYLNYRATPNPLELSLLLRDRERDAIARVPVPQQGGE